MTHENFIILFRGDHKQKFYWGHREILIPIYKNMSDAMKKHPEADVLINFASLRSAYESTMETLTYPQVIEMKENSLIKQTINFLCSNHL